MRGALQRFSWSFSKAMWTWMIRYLQGNRAVSLAKILWWVHFVAIPTTEFWCWLLRQDCELLESENLSLKEALISRQFFCWLGHALSDRDLASVTPECIVEMKPPHIPFIMVHTIHVSQSMIQLSHYESDMRYFMVWGSPCFFVKVLSWCNFSLISIHRLIHGEMGSDHWLRL